MTSVEQRPPGFQFHTDLDDRFRQDDQESFSQWTSHVQGAIEKQKAFLARRLYRAYNRVTKPFVKTIYFVALASLFPIGLTCLYGALKENKVNKLKGQQKRIEKLWAERLDAWTTEVQTPYITSASEALNALAGGEKVYESLPSEHSSSEANSLYRVTKDGVNGLGIKCFDEASRKPLTVELFLEDVAKDRTSAFETCLRGPKHFVTVSVTRDLTCTMTWSYSSVDKLVQDPEGWIRPFYQLIRYGNTGIMAEDSTIHAKLKLPCSVPKNLFPRSSKFWP